MIPQGYPLWFAISGERAGRIVAWTEVDRHQGLWPVVMYQGGAAASTVLQKGWFGETADEALKAAAEGLEPPRRWPGSGPDPLPPVRQVDIP